MRQTRNLLSQFSLSAGMAGLDQLARLRSRYVLHGVAVVVGLATLSSIAVQPRATTASLAPSAVAPEVGPAPLDLDRAASSDQLEMAALDASSTADDTTQGADLQDTTPAPPPAADPAPSQPDAAAPAKPVVHTVEDGETLRDIADRFGVSPDTIAAANSLSNPDMLKVGQDLVILPMDGVMYKLRDGESIRRVADRFGVDAADIVKANDLGADPNVVPSGTLLMVPGASPQAAGKSTVVVQHSDDGEQQIAAIGPGVELPADTAVQAVPSTRTYEVQSGDTLATIAQTFGVDVDTVLSSNGIDDPDTIRPGSELRILPVKGVEYTVQPSETLADIAYKYQVDLGLLLDYNDLNDPDVLRVGTKLVLPDGKLRPDAAPAPVAIVDAPAPTVRTQSAVAVPAIVQAPAPKPAAPKPVATAAAPKPVAADPAPAPKPAAAAPAAPQLSIAGGGGGIVANAMKYVGYRYVFGGTSPSGFDCSGFVYYIHNHSGAPVGRGMWQQFNGGAHIPVSSLQPGDTVFFANTYMAGLSHDGIYIGGGQFIHASDERTGVTISSMNTSYWQSHYAGATRLWD